MDYFKFAADNARIQAVEAEPYIHRIARWTVGDGQTLNETPLCGRRDNEAMLNRTQYANTVTCPQCIAYAAYLESQHAK